MSLLSFLLPSGRRPRRISPPLLFLLTLLPALAQPAPEERTFRIFSVVGTLSDLKFEPRPGAAPMPVPVGRDPSLPFPCPRGETLALFRELPLPADAPPAARPPRQIVATVSIPLRQSRTLVVVSPAAEGQLSALALDDSPERHHPGTIRLVNLSRFEAAAALNDAQHPLAPGASAFVPYGPGGLLIQIAVRNPTRWTVAYRRERMARPDTRAYAFIFPYMDDPEISAGPQPPPVLVKLLAETPPPPPPAS